MTWVDFVIIGVVLISAVFGVVRGFVKEALSMTGWVASFIIAWHFNAGLAGILHGFIANPNLQFLVGFVILFILSMLMFALVIFFASRLVQRTGLTSTDRAIGMVFGLVRGLVVAVALVAFAGLTTLPHSASWQDSLLTGRLQTVAIWMTGFLPESMAKNFIFK
jgi:membrane protein required for colicin V production